MARQIILYPNGKLNLFSTTVDAFLFGEPCTREQYINWERKEAADGAESRALDTFKKLDAGEDPYYGHGYSRKEAEAIHRRTTKGK